MLLGDARAWIDDYTKYQAVTADDVQRVARSYLTEANLTLMTIPPQGGGK
jgi:predicted Zn-dependent peptidase